MFQSLRCSKTLMFIIALQLDSSNLHQMDMAIKFLPKSNFGLILKMAENGRYIRSLRSNGFIISKRPSISLSLVLGVWNVKTTNKISWPETFFQELNFTFDHLLQGHVWSSLKDLIHSLTSRASKFKNNS